MCTGIEIMMAVGAAASTAAAVKAMTAKGPDLPGTSAISPIADQAKIDTASAGAGLTRRRAMRVSSLLATGGAGDAASPITGTPAAMGKQTLGG